MEKEKHFSELVELIHKLDEIETKAVLSFLNAFNPQKKQENKSTKLFIEILNNPEPTYEKTLANTGYNGARKSFDRITQRLKNKIYEIMLLDVATNRKDRYSIATRKKIKITKQLAIVELIIGRGLEKQTISLLNNSIGQAKKYEHYELLVKALIFKQQIEALLYGDKINKLQNQIEHFENCKKAVDEARDWYFKYFSVLDFKAYPNGRIGLLSKAIADLQNSYKKTGATYVKYFLVCLSMEYYQTHKDYKRVRKIGLHLLKMTKNSPAIYMKRREGNIYSGIAENEMPLFEFENCIYYSKIASEKFEKNGFDYFVAKEYEFYGYYYSKDLKKSAELLEEITREGNQYPTPFKKGKGHYLKASLGFLKKDFKSSYKTLQQTKEIEKDTEGWNTWIKILTILNYIELSMLDQADFQIENFRRFIQRNFDNSEFRERDLVIMKILSKLESNDFDFKKVYKENTELISQLTTGKEELRWEIKSPELIIFDQWFMSKVNNTKYDPVYEPTTPFTSTPVDKIIPEVEFEKTG